ncbi:tRNA 2-thiouridine synthesizing protein A [Frankia sp. EI5c]|uniref:sulfurtransferase TusA family protein n=1 Tax=Frankia sp. EI5c TaxID=683316 RepID=UPI0007C30959|nr:sulfurtransferase TusA family protein [Frankia sp. EI5c]OAA28307.1 tRNA 2-thiouridine synthesizing protein A [Frankia sp. EI5c]
MTGGPPPPAGGTEPARAEPARAEPARAVVDARGRRCPIPIIELARHLGDVEVGQLIELLADDPAAAADVAAWCRMRGHELVAAQHPPLGGDSYLVRRCR